MSKQVCPEQGPLLFIIYMIDITDEIESDILIFADDTSLMATGSDPAETAKQLNRDLETILFSQTL